MRMRAHAEYRSSDNPQCSCGPTHGRTERPRSTACTGALPCQGWVLRVIPPFCFNPSHPTSDQHARTMQASDRRQGSRCNCCVPGLQSLPGIGGIEVSCLCIFQG